MPCQKRLKEVQQAADEVGEVEVGDGWNEIGDISGSGQKEAGKDQEMFDLDQEMNTANVVGDKK